MIWVIHCLADVRDIYRMHARLAKHEQAHGGTSLEFLRTHPGAERRIKVSCGVYFQFQILILALAS